MAEENPYVPPTAPIDSSAGVVDIDTLSISNYWKEKFKAMQKAGGPDCPNVKDLTPEEKKKLGGFNIVAFLLGPIYYLAKGMWRKAITMTVLLVLALTIIEEILKMIGFGSFAKALNMTGPITFAVLANMDYYRKVVMRQNGWWW